MKVLILHGFGQTAEIIQQRGRNLFKTLRKSHQLYFPEGPFTVKLYGSLSDPLVVKTGKAWYTYDATNPNNFTKYLRMHTTTWLGLEESLQLLKSYSLKHGPFDCVFGFSQGAHFAPLVAQELQINKIILMSGFLTPIASNYDLKPITAETLHIYADNDDLINTENTRKLIEFCNNPKIYTHNKGHSLAQISEVKTRIEAFLI